MRSFCLSVIVVNGLLWLPCRGVAETDFMATLVTRSFFRGLLEGEVGTILPLCADTMSFDGTQVHGKQKIEQQLKQINRRALSHAIRLQRIQVLTYNEAIRRYGPPPDRLKGSIRPGQLVALARFNTLGAVAVLKRYGPFWRVIALTD
jgi:hypothetical protein